VCTDWLKTGGYGRGIRFHEALVERVRHAGARTREAFVLRASGHEEAALAAAGVTGEEAQRALAALRTTGTLEGAGLAPGVAARWVKEAARLNTATYVEGLAKDPRYHRGHHERPPRKVGSQLSTFDCLTCDKCVAVCPNDALFTYVAPHLEVPQAIATRGEGGAVRLTRTGTLRVDERHQIASFADHCNDCGNCDAFCPEDGGPFLRKPRFFGSLAALREDPRGEGIFAVRTPAGYRAHVRSGGREVVVCGEGRRVRYSGEGFSLVLDPYDAEAPAEAAIEGDVDVTLARVTHVIVTSVLSAREVNPVSVMEEGR
jgi:putative selenate reductase